LERYEAVVTDGDAVRVTPEVVHDVLGRAKGGFGINHPVLLEKGVHKALKAFGLTP
jgi:hypothetical protein